MLKKLFSLIIATIILLSVGVINSKPVFDGYAKTFEVYIGSNSSSAKIVSANKKDLLFMNNIHGQAFIADKDAFDLKGFLKEFDAKIISVEKIDEGVSYYAYSPKIKYVNQLFGKPVNLQIFVGETVKVGSPMIYGSF